MRKRAVVLTICSMVFSLVASAQQSSAWQKAAGTSMTFEVVSVRPDNGPFKTPSFPLSADDSFEDPNGRFHADFTLDAYIAFAYKIWLTGEERNNMIAGLPDWVKSERFDIEATAPEHATKDQFRLMMQSLLAERFALKLHFEQKERPVLAMVLLKPGTPGPRLTPHDKGVPCDAPKTSGVWPPRCYTYMARPDKDGLWVSGSRATTMDLLGNFVGSLAGNSDEISRHVVDQTGLTGLWDFTLLAQPPHQISGADAQTGPTALQAIREQLGIKLRPDHAEVSLPVIDHVQRPDDN